jgi:hypothetical protein
MVRHDLLGLAADDLVALSNRGIVNRAQREVEEATTPIEVDESPEGTIVARWPDGAVCRLIAGEIFSGDSCTCAATTVCRHLVGTILAYQRRTARASERTEQVASWDPGAISDEALASCWSGRDIAAAQQIYRDGLVVELHRGPRPRARFYSLGHCVRFLVPGDVNYTRCDCADPAPCRHALLAIWAFRLLPADRASGLTTTAEQVEPVPSEVLAEIDHSLEALVDYGLATLPESLARRLERLETNCRQSDLVWLAEIIAELLLARQQYQAHDARFSPSQVAMLIGELAIRTDAARAPEQSVPRTFICGSSAEGIAVMGNSRLIGLGSAVESRPDGITLTAFFQDAATAVVLAIPRQFAEDEGDECSRSFAALARTVVLKGASLADVAAGQIVIRGGKRTPGGELRVGRAGAAVSPQDYRWELLRPPVMAGGFADLTADQSLRPHPYLSPRSLTEGVSVCPIAGVEDVRFDVREQTVVATLRDADGQSARLVHPFYSRGRAGAEALLSDLGNSKLLFVSGKARLDPAGVVISPMGLVFERDSDRWLLQPWICDDAISRSDRIPARLQHNDVDPLRRHLGELLGVLGEVAVLGRDRVPGRLWQDLRAQSSALGLVKLPEYVKPDSILTLAAIVAYAISDPASK